MLYVTTENWFIERGLRFSANPYQSDLTATVIICNNQNSTTNQEWAIDKTYVSKQFQGSPNLAKAGYPTLLNYSQIYLLYYFWSVSCRQIIKQTKNIFFMVGSWLSSSSMAEKRATLSATLMTSKYWRTSESNVNHMLANLQQTSDASCTCIDEIFLTVVLFSNLDCHFCAAYA